MLLPKIVAMGFSFFVPCVWEFDLVSHRGLPTRSLPSVMRVFEDRVLVLAKLFCLARWCLLMKSHFIPFHSNRLFFGRAYLQAAIISDEKKKLAVEMCAFENTREERGNLTFKLLH